MSDINEKVSALAETTADSHKNLLELVLHLTDRVKQLEQAHNTHSHDFYVIDGNIRSYVRDELVVRGGSSQHNSDEPYKFQHDDLLARLGPPTKLLKDKETT